MKHEITWHTEKGWIKDKANRARIFRGCSISGASRVPFTPCGETWCNDNLNNKYDVSFTGRPFTEEAADEHFARLSSLGCNCIRWYVTWEAVEHAGPDEYDEDYLAYLRQVLKKAEKYEINVVIDPHQEAWSRWTGGDGAPAWTLEKVGFDLEKIEKCGTAYTNLGKNWSSNYKLYACQTMYTLFFAGNEFAPHCKIDGCTAQDYLQEHYINAMNHLARRIKDCDAVIGFYIFDEPNSGFIDTKDLLLSNLNKSEGIACSPFDAIKAASGYKVELTQVVNNFAGLRTTKKILVNSENNDSVFLEGFKCPWLEEGVWHTDNDIPVLDKSNYFVATKENTSFSSYLEEFSKVFMETLQIKHPQYLFFTNCTLKDAMTVKTYKVPEVNFNPSNFGEFLKRTISTNEYLLEQDKKQFIDSIKTARKAGNVPFAGRFGISFNLDGVKSAKTSNFPKYIELMKQYYTMFDDLLLSSFLDNYTPTNTLLHGDGWNDENYSVFCASIHDLRGTHGFCRPYVIATAGQPIKMSFTNDTHPIFEFEWDSVECPTASGEADTEIYLPNRQFGAGWKIEKFDGVGVLREVPEKQRLYVKTLEARRCFIRVVEK